MKLVSWNVNGLRACAKKGFFDYFQRADADVFCLQETKMQPHQAEIETPGYFQYWNSAEKKGYSGTAAFTRREPISVSYDIGDPAHVGEGRDGKETISASLPYRIHCGAVRRHSPPCAPGQRRRWDMSGDTASICCSPCWPPP